MERKENKELRERVESLETKVKKIENNLEDINMALELIKTYGFNPKEYNEMLEILKSNKK
jgi:uncharacterized protein (UPF0335 family)